MKSEKKNAVPSHEARVIYGESSQHFAGIFPLNKRASLFQYANRSFDMRNTNKPQAGFRVNFDDSSDSLGKKIKQKTEHAKYLSLVNKRWMPHTWAP